jgi:hypothetical protein
MEMSVKGEPDLVRTEAGYLQNTNNASYQAFISKRDKIVTDTKRIEAIEKDNAEIKRSLALIIQMLGDDQK